MHETATFDIVSDPGDRDCVIEISGDLNQQGLRHLGRVVREAMAEHPDVVILNLVGVRFYDVSALAGVLAAARQDGLAGGVRLSLRAPRETLRGLLPRPEMDLMLSVVPTVSRRPDRYRRPCPSR